MAIAVAAQTGNTWNTTSSPLTASVTVANGDWLAILCADRSSAATFSASGGSPALTFTNQTSANANASCPATAIITAPSSSGQTFTLSVARAGNAFAWGFVCLQLTGVLAVGAKTSAQDAVSGVEQTTITTTAANSALVIALNDKDSGAAPTWVTASAGAFTAQGTTNTTQSNYTGIYLNVGAIGLKTVGVSSPSGFASSISVLEFTPTVVAGNPRPPLLASQAVKRASFW